MIKDPRFLPLEEHEPEMDSYDDFNEEDMLPPELKEKRKALYIAS